MMRRTASKACCPDFHGRWPPRCPLLCGPAPSLATRDGQNPMPSLPRLVRQVSATFETGNVRKYQVRPFGDHLLNGSNGEGFRVPSGVRKPSPCRSTAYRGRFSESGQSIPEPRCCWRPRSAAEPTAAPARRRAQHLARWERQLFMWPGPNAVRPEICQKGRIMPLGTRPIRP
jgi:hypothetical protein